MSVRYMEFLVEEPSMEAFLSVLLPRLLPEGCEYRIHPFRSKPDLKRNIANRIRGYSRWISPDHRIFVLVDRDNDDCMELKGEFEEVARLAGLRTPSYPGCLPWQIVNRIVIEELEAWYFGDWQAVRSAYPNVSANVPQNSRYRDPDSITNTWETFERILKRSGYYRSGLRKIEVARNIAKHICPERNRSRSFKLFRRTIKGVVESDR